MQYETISLSILQFLYRLNHAGMNNPLNPMLSLLLSILVAGRWYPRTVVCLVMNRTSCVGTIQANGLLHDAHDIL